MATTKKRLNITLSPESELLVTQLAARDRVPAATKVRELLELSLEMVEDQILTELGEERLLAKDTSAKSKKSLTHEEVWG